MGIFFTNSRSTGSLNVSVLPTSWLHLAYKDGTPSRGSYISQVHKVISCNYSGCRPHIIHCVQFADEEDGTPILPPNRFGDSIIDDTSESRKTFRTLLDHSSSNRYGCRKYVQSAFHQTIPSTCYIYDPIKSTNLPAIFRINVHDSNGRSESQSLMKVYSFLENDTLIGSLDKATQSFLLKKGKMGNTRHSAGDIGHMNGFGIMPSRTSSDLIEIEMSPPTEEPSTSMLNLCTEFAELSATAFPTFWSGVQILESTCSLFPPVYLGGSNGVSSSISISVDLMNSSHYNVNDGSVGVVLFSESQQKIGFLFCQMLFCEWTIFLIMDWPLSCVTVRRFCLTVE